jgi:hypothetical protein
VAQLTRASMSKQHFKAIARAVYSVKGANDLLSQELTQRLVYALASELRQFNPAFDAERFRLVCMEGKVSR